MAYLDRLFPSTNASMPPARTTSDGSKKRSLPFKAPRPISKSAPSAPVPSKAGSKATAKKQTATRVASLNQAKATSRSNGPYKPKGRQAGISDDDEDPSEDEEDEDDVEEQQQSAATRRRVDDEDTDMEEMLVSDVLEETTQIMDDTFVGRKQFGMT